MPTESDYAVPPGETLLETLEALGMSTEDLSVLTGLAITTISDLISGAEPISEDIAERLEQATRVPARLWMNLQRGYEKDRERLDARQYGADD